eukprot:1222686-Pyramimonas_sp.AAC.1
MPPPVEGEIPCPVSSSLPPPPPPTSPPPPPSPPWEYRCDLRLGVSGGVREAPFPTRRRPLLHRAKSRRPNHGHPVLARVVTVSTACILCGNLYTTQRYAGEPLAESLERGQ